MEKEVSKQPVASQTQGRQTSLSPSWPVPGYVRMQSSAQAPPSVTRLLPHLPRGRVCLPLRLATSLVQFSGHNGHRRSGLTTTTPIRAGAPSLHVTLTHEH